MKNKIIFTLLTTMFLVGCKPTETPSISSSSMQVVEDSEELPEIPTPGGNVGAVTLGATVIDGEIPQGWAYITNNDDYPHPEFYTDGGLKLNFPNMGLKSGTFDETVSKVKLEGKLNKNTRTGAATKLEIYKLVDDNEVLVDGKTFGEGSASTYSFEITMPADTTQFFIKLAANGGYNVNLKTITAS